MSAAASLIRISNYQVEVLQKRLADTVERLRGVKARAEENAGAGWYLIGYRNGLKLRMDAVQAHIDACILEETGARDALSEAFEALKKYEQVEANAQAAAAKLQAKIETAALDELGLRRKAVR